MSQGNTIKEWAKTIIISVVIAFVITTFIRPTLVKGYSMYPTINQYDYLIINRIPYISHEPEYGDIVVFKTNQLTVDGSEKDLIKRVIGLPGDVIEIKEGIVYRNGEALTEPYIYGGYTPGEMELVTIEEDKIFVMGDNRPNSLDSRDERVGEVPMSSIMGKVIVRLFPFNKIGTVD